MGRQAPIATRGGLPYSQALQYDPRGLRTIGVVTKCDTLPARGDFVPRMLMARDAVTAALGLELTN